MADVQLRNGHVRIANSLYDALLAAPLSKRELLVMLAVLRLTYGWRKKHDYIGSVQLSRMTGITPRHCRATLVLLSHRNMIRFRTHGGGRRREIEPVKDYESWDLSPGPKEAANTEKRGPKSGLKPGPNQAATRPKSGRLHKHSSTDNKQKSAPPEP